MFNSDDVTMNYARRAPKITLEIPTLRVMAGRDMLRFVSIPAGETVLIGRDEQADLCLTAPTVSKRHATIVSDEIGVLTLTDLESTNGTTCNNRPVSKVVLSIGDLVEIGEVSLRLEALSLPEIGHLARVVRRLEAAGRDPLTKLLNRRFIQDELSDMVDGCVSSGAPISCAFVDLDHFKQVNDRFGHAVGDAVLRDLSRLLMVNVRGQDPCIRYGGDEILVIFPSAGRNAAAMIARRFCEVISDHDWSRLSAELEVTVSIGIAEMRKGEDTASWLKRADAAIFESKRGGRNQVSLAVEI